MRATDLAINNYVYSVGYGVQDPEKEVVQVKGIDLSGLRHYVITQREGGEQSIESSDFIEPIPLTEEGVERIGFKYKKDNIYAIRNIKAYITHSWFVIIDNANPIRVEYVHQLQNLVNNHLQEKP